MVRGDLCQDMESLTNGADVRLTSIGFRGFYLCEVDDLKTRANFAEAIVLDELSRLEDGAKARNG
jgi:hypothetical protein